MSARLLKAGAIYAAANALAAGIPFLLLPVLTRALVPADYGLVVNFFLLATLCSSLAGLSVHGAVAVKWFDRKARDFPRLVGNALIVAAISTLLCGALMAGVSPLLDHSIGLPLALWIGAAAYAGSAVITAIRASLWQSQENALAAAALQVSGATLNGALSLIGVFVLHLGGEGRILGALAASLATAAAATLMLVLGRQVRWAVNTSDLRELVRFGATLAPHTLAGAMLGSIDRFAVAAILGREELGIYGTAAQLGLAIGVIGDALTRALSPWVYRQLAQRSMRGRLRFVASTYLSIPFWLLVSALLWAALRAAGPILLDERYLPALHLSIWFFVGGAVAVMYLSIAPLFFFAGKNEWLSTATMTAAAAATVSAPLLTRHFGAVGAAASYVLAQVLLLALAWLFSTRIQPMPWSRPRLALRVLRHTGRN